MDKTDFDINFSIAWRLLIFFSCLHVVLLGLQSNFEHIVNRLKVVTPFF